MLPCLIFCGSNCPHCSPSSAAYEIWQVTTKLGQESLLSMSMHLFVSFTVLSHKLGKSPCMQKYTGVAIETLGYLGILPQLEGKDRSPGIESKAPGLSCQCFTCSQCPQHILSGCQVLRLKHSAPHVQLIEDPILYIYCSHHKLNPGLMVWAASLMTTELWPPGNHGHSSVVSFSVSSLSSFRLSITISHYIWTDWSWEKLRCHLHSLVLSGLRTVLHCMYTCLHAQYLIHIAMCYVYDTWRKWTWSQLVGWRSLTNKVSMLTLTPAMR